MIVPSRLDLEAIWCATLEDLPTRVQRAFTRGRFLESTSDTAVFQTASPLDAQQCEALRPRVDDALATQFGAPVPLKIVDSTGSSKSI